MTQTQAPATSEHEAPAGSPAPEPSFEELASRVDDAVRKVGELDGPARETAEELRAALEAVHRAGLLTIVRRLRSDDRTRDVLFDLVDEPEVRMLLLLHGIIRPDPVTEANRVLESVRPALQSHGGDVELSHVDDGVAYVRLLGACDGCSMSSVTLRGIVEEALVGNVVAIHRVEVLPNEPSPTLIPLGEVGIGRPGGDSTGPSAEADVESAADEERRERGWVRTKAVDELPDGEISPMRLVAGSGIRQDVIVVRFGDKLSAFVNACAHEGLPIDGALIERMIREIKV